MALSIHGDLMSRISEFINAVQQDGWDVQYAPDSNPNQQGCCVTLARNGETRNIRVYAWDVTTNGEASGVQRPADERRIQITRTAASGGIDQGEGFDTLVLGYSDRFSTEPVFVSFDSEATAHRVNALLNAKISAGQPNARVSPNQQLKQAQIDEANSGGIAFATNKFGGNIVVVRRDRISDLLAPTGEANTAPAAVSVEPGTPSPIQTIGQNEVGPPDLSETIYTIETLSAAVTEQTENEIQVTVNLQQRREAQRRHDEVVRKFNNTLAERTPEAVVLDRDLPQQTISSIEGCQPDLGVRFDAETGFSSTLIAEAKSLPDDVGGQWSQVMVGIGELARYSHEYRETHSSQPMQVLALEFQPEDEGLLSFLEDLSENNEIVVVWVTDNDDFESF